jgi:hypothetical protein
MKDAPARLPPFSPRERTRRIHRLRPLGRARRPPACAASPAFRSARRTRRDRSPNGLICFTNCLQLQEDGALVARDLWIDERRGVVLDAQVRPVAALRAAAQC